MNLFPPNGARPRISAIAFLLLGLGANIATGQVEWLKDASGAKISTGSVTGQVDGKTVATLKFGHLDTAGGLELGSPDRSFVHYKISLQDAEMFFDAKAFAYITVTVRKGELPDGKTFRRTPAHWQEQPGIRGDGHWVPEFLSLSMESRKMSMREQKTGEFGLGSVLSDSIERPFTGRVEFEKRKGDKITVHLYVCFDDKSKSCLAGTAEIEIR
jgi:hypothetical protein